MNRKGRPRGFDPVHSSDAFFDLYIQTYQALAVEVWLCSILGLGLRRSHECFFGQGGRRVIDVADTGAATR